MTTYEFTYLKCLELCFVYFLMLAVVIFFLIFMKKAIIYIFKKCVCAGVWVYVCVYVQGYERQKKSAQENIFVWSL